MELTAAQRIAQRFVSLPLEQRQQVLAKMQASGQSFRLLPIMPTRQGLARIPLSFAQQRLLFLWQLEPDSAFYNVSMAVRLSGALEPARLQQALTALVQRHEALRTRLLSVDGEFHQEVLEAPEVTLEVVEFAHDDDEAQLEATVRDDLARPFDLLQGPLLRVRLLQLGGDQHVLTVCMHHIVSDGWSSELLVKEFIALYTALGEGREANLAPLSIQYPDYAIWQRAWLEAGEAERQLQYWQAQLGDEQPVLSLPLDQPRPAQPSYRGAVLPVKLSAEVSDALRRQARQSGTTLFTLVLAAMAVVLSRYSGQADVRIGAPNAGRNRQELEGLIGFFINTQVLRVQVDERETFAELLAQLKEVIAGAQSHQELPFEQLVDALLPERNLAHNPLFQFKINQHVAGGQPARTQVGELTLAPFTLDGGDARFDLAFDFSDRPDGIEGYFTYATDLFEPDTIERLAAALRRTVQRLADGDTQRLCEKPEPAAVMPASTPGPASSSQFPGQRAPADFTPPDPTAVPVGAALAAMGCKAAPTNLAPSDPSAVPVGAALAAMGCKAAPTDLAPSDPTAVPVGAALAAMGCKAAPTNLAPSDPTAAPVGAAIAAMGCKTAPTDPTSDSQEQHRAPHRPNDLLTLWQNAEPAQASVRAGTQHIDRQQLDADSNRLAAYLREQGIGPGNIVALCQPRSIEWVTALLAVLKTGAAYLPLDPQQPVERLDQLLQDSAAAALIHDASDTRFTDQTATPRIPYAPQQWHACSAEPVAISVSPDHPAYLIYTSGSTGTPKGVLVSHGALTSYLHAVLERLALPTDASLAMVSTPAADLGHTVLFGALMSGRDLHLLPAELAFDPDGFAAYMAEHQVGVVKLVPSHLQGLLQASRAADVLPAHALIVGGEACSWALLEQVQQLRPGCRVINHYGPTETTVGVLTHEPVIHAEDCRSVPIGRPLNNAHCVLLDAWLNPVPEQVAGELYLGGQGLAHGYLNRPGLTAERFIPAEGGTRLYRSGDRARLSRDGVLEFLARADDQVKIRGYRVEPGEVGQRLASLPGVREAVVHAVALDSDDTRLQLVGWCVAAERIEAADLQRQLHAQLPDYLVPAHILLLDRLPLTANGKLDKRALPLPGSISRGFEAPEGEVEETLAAIWAEVLKLEQVGRSDNFFELGGDSILSLQIIARAKRRGLRITPKQLFEKQTVALLAAVAKPLAAKPAATAPLVETRPVTVPLLPVQQRFFELDLPERHYWNQSLLLTPLAPVQPAALEAALRDVLTQHDALRTAFSNQADHWQGQVQPPSEAPVLSQQTLTTLSELDAAGAAMQASLDLAHGPLLRAALFDLPAGEQRLLLVIHHLAVDGVSWRVLLEDLQHAYRQRLQGTTVDLGARCTSPGRWAERLQGYASGAALTQRDYWQQVQQAQACLPQDTPDASLSRRHTGHAHTRLSREHTAQLLKQAPAAYRTQVNDLLLTALGQVLCEWSGQPQVKVLLEGHGREDLFDDLDLSRSVGWFTSLFPVSLRPAADLAQTIKAIKERLRSVPDKGLGYGVLRYLGDAETRQSLHAGSEARLTFNYLGQFDGSFSAADGALFAPAREQAGSNQSADAPLGNWLSISGQVYDGELLLEWTYSQAMYRSETLERLAQAYQQALVALIEHCCDAAHAGVTPSDFPLAGLTQAQLDELPVPASQIADLYPLSPLQQGLLFHTLYAEGGSQYINQLRVDVEQLDSARFRDAWQATLQAHAILRSGFVWQGDLEQAVQVVHKQVQVPLVEYDWRGQPDLPGALQALSDRERGQPFDLGAAPLLRLALVRTDDQRHHLIYTNHHILLDGWSTSRMLGEVLQRYAGQPPAAPQGHYRDYIAWLQRQDAAASEAFWRGQVAELQAPTRLADALGGGDLAGVAGQVAELQAPTRLADVLGGGDLAGAAGQVAELQTPTRLADALGGGDLAGVAGQGEHRQRFDREQTATLEAFARGNRITVNTLVQAAWLLLLQRYTGQTSVCLGVTVAGRPTELAGIEEQIGLFINTLPVIGTPRVEQTVGEWLSEVQARNLALREHEHTPLFEVQRWANLGSDSLFDSLLVFENYPVAEALQQSAASGLRFGPVAVQEQTHYPLTLVVELGDTLAVQYSHDRARVAEAAVQQLAGHFAHLLMALVHDARTPLGELTLLDVEQQQQMIERWNPGLRSLPSEDRLHPLIEAQGVASPEATAVTCGELALHDSEQQQQTIERWDPSVRSLPSEDRLHPLIEAQGVASPEATAVTCGELALHDSEQQKQLVEGWNPSMRSLPLVHCLHARIEAQVEATPQATAVTCGEHVLSYDTLNRRANRLAHHLRTLGVGPDVLVGVAVERSVDMVVGLLAILKAGGAYVPLDPESPAERLAYLFADSGIEVLVTQAHLRAELPAGDGLQTVLLDDVDALASYSDSNPVSNTTPDNLAYVIYTSGSTGKPKGTLLAHRNVVRLFSATEHWFQFDARDVWTVFHSYAFDFSVWELYGALLYGGKAVIVPKDVARSPEDFHALLLREQVTVLNQTPSAFKPLMVVACESAQPLALRHVVFGGEALEVSSLKPWFDTFGDARPQLTNMYGITETTVHVSYRPIRLSDVENGLSSPIGEAIPDLAWYLLDSALNPVVPGTQGELMIARAGLARGYHNRPSLTAERFIPNPFDAAGGRLYRSGDLACARRDGVIEYAGRIDHQVKIRGFRIELGEIEARLQAQPGVRQVAVVAQDGIGGKQLVAYVVPTDISVAGDLEAQTTLRDTLRTALKASLQEHMVPAHLLFLAVLPLTGNGKLDYKALPLPDASLLQGAYVAPGSELERQVAAIWADVLKIEQVGLHDNFFELGGHSLLATTAMVRIREQTGAAVELKALFEHATLADFCEHLERLRTHVDPVQAQLAQSLAALKRLTAEEIDELTS